MSTDRVALVGLYVVMSLCFLILASQGGWIGMLTVLAAYNAGRMHRRG